jgi:hypothetical protein
MDSCCYIATHRKSAFTWLANAIPSEETQSNFTMLFGQFPWLSHFGVLAAKSAIAPASFASSFTALRLIEGLACVQDAAGLPAEVGDGAVGGTAPWLHVSMATPI